MSTRDIPANSISAYAAKFAAETVHSEPARYVEPTDENLMECLQHCGIVPKQAWLQLIRQAFIREYINTSTESR